MPEGGVCAKKNLISSGTLLEDTHSILHMRKKAHQNQNKEKDTVVNYDDEWRMSDKTRERKLQELKAEFEKLGFSINMNQWDVAQTKLNEGRKDWYYMYLPENLQWDRLQKVIDHFCKKEKDAAEVMKNLSVGKAKRSRSIFDSDTDEEGTEQQEEQGGLPSVKKTRRNPPAQEKAERSRKEDTEEESAQEQEEQGHLSSVKKSRHTPAQSIPIQRRRKGVVTDTPQEKVRSHPMAHITNPTSPQATSETLTSITINGVNIPELKRLRLRMKMQDEYTEILAQRIKRLEETTYLLTSV